MSLTLQTTHGNIKIELFCELCPKACKNFMALAASGRYDGTIFHRNIKGLHPLIKVSLSREATLQELVNKAKASTVNHLRMNSYKASNMIAEESSPWRTADRIPTEANFSSLTTECQS